MKASRLADGTDVTSTLLAFLNTGAQFYMVDLYDILLSTLGFPFPVSLFLTSGEVPVPFGGVTYDARGVRLSRGQIHCVRGIEVDTMDVTVQPLPTDLLPPADGNPSSPQIPVLDAIAHGLFDRALVKVRRLMLPAPLEFGQTLDVSRGAVVMFSGIVADVEASRTRAVLHVRSWLDLLRTKFPRNLYQAGCLNMLYDTACGVSRAGSDPQGHPFAAAGTVGAGTTLNQIATSAGQAPTLDFFALGTVQFTAGVLAGFRAAIRSTEFFGTGLHYTLVAPLPRLPTVGDAFTAYAGCNKTLAACRDKFNNLARFRGFPSVPPPETAI